jgi:predicted metalloprotease
VIEPGDFEAGLRAASAIGDDRLQRISQDSVAPDSLTPGRQVSALETGEPGCCDTFRSSLDQ